MVIYYICGISDILDGFLARKTNSTSEFGARLDSLADLVMVFVVMYLLIPLIRLEFYVYIFIGVIVMVRVVSLVIVMVKFKSFGILHTYGNKLTGISLFIGIGLMGVLPVTVLGILLCIMGLLSAVEELVIHIKSDELNLECKGLIIK